MGAFIMIAVDVGNTSLHFAWGKDNKIIKTVQLSTHKATIKAIGKIICRYPNEEIFVCSVVPAITELFKKLGHKVNIIGRDITVPVRCLYNKKKVGMDRLVGAFAAKVLYPHVRIIIDFGTAITFDVLSKSGDYEGGLILPGVGSTLKVLSVCALLPKKIVMKKTKRLVPRDTSESISKGVEEGFSAMMNALVKKYKKSLKLSDCDAIVITGGDARYILPKIGFSYVYDPYLVIKGTFILSRRIPRGLAYSAEVASATKAGPRG
ncbi:MAG: type III pantothenate kinase [Candidatus Omnitrophota bacterium]|nr:type III pantothenate kinase [Candidatus Omnitrophota bacterium]